MLVGENMNYLTERRQQAAALLAVELNCRPEDFGRTENIITASAAEISHSTAQACQTFSVDN